MPEGVGTGFDGMATPAEPVAHLRTLTRGYAGSRCCLPVLGSIVAGRVKAARRVFLARWERASHSVEARREPVGKRVTASIALSETSYDAAVDQ
ncbi:hypothetical protein ABZZ74_48315 [Streptomyces sp. NPDC006476]|uniref:hypothetical protein n=1 Tax=Streptomyces sp. NPDC006476 TaxID=3157175 RepID=UPI0033A4F3BB